MYKKGLTKSQYKVKMKLFWTNHWRYLTPEKWIELINDRIQGAIHLRMLLAGIEKLILEKKCTKEEGTNLSKMIKSPDQESVFLAIMIMAKHKPKKFLKNE